MLLSMRAKSHVLQAGNLRHQWTSVRLSLSRDCAWRDDELMQKLSHDAPVVLGDKNISRNPECIFGRVKRLTKWYTYVYNDVTCVCVRLCVYDCRYVRLGKVTRISVAWWRISLLRKSKPVCSRTASTPY